MTERFSLNAGMLGAASPSPESRLVAGVSHDLHTAMNGVLGMLELLLDSELGPAQREFAQMAQASAEDLLQRINTMLDHAGIDNGGAGLESVAFDLCHELEAASHPYQEAAHARGMRLQVSHSAVTLPQVLGNPVRLRQVLASLLENAIRIAKGDILTVTAETDVRDGACQLELAVRCDHIEPDSMPALSLAASRHLVELMGGQVVVENEAGSPCTWRMALRLPLAPGPYGQVDAAPDMAPKAIFVEADAEQRVRFADQLARCGVRADGVASAAAVLPALELASDNGAPYQIALFDQSMPGIDGETLGCALKSDPTYRSLHLELFGAPADAAQAPRLAQAGFSAWLPKPIAPAALADTLAALREAIACGRQPAFLTTDAPPAAASATSPAEARFAGYRVLVADDVHVNQQVAVHLLKKLGCTVETAVNGLQAVALHARQPFDLILMDCKMPELDGYAATARIRATETGKRTPIIAVTAYAMQGERDHCLTAGMDDFLAKPIRLRTLRDSLRRWLAPSAAAAQSAVLDDEHDELAAMQEMFGDDFAELATLFLNDSPKRLDALRNPADANDAERLAALTHSLGGSCASIGATRLATLCRELELRCRAGNLDDYPAHIDVIGIEYARIESKLKAMVAQISSRQEAA